MATAFADAANKGELSSSEQELAAQGKRIMELEKARRKDEGVCQKGLSAVDLGQQSAVKNMGMCR